MLALIAKRIVNNLPDSHRIMLHNAVALPLIAFGSSFLAGGRLIYEPPFPKQVAGFRPDRFAEGG